MHTTSGASSPSRILIVDDDVRCWKASKAPSGRQGKMQRRASSFELARQMLRSEEFDVLVTDVRLGAFNGLQLALLARDLYPQITLIVFSGFDDPVLRAEAEHAGAAYVVKPVAASTLLELARRRRPAA